MELTLAALQLIAGVRKPISSSIHNVSSLIPESRLPREVLARGDPRGNEYAWRRTDLPLVFEAAQAAGLADLVEPQQ